MLSGSITCAAYPLEQIDTIDLETGNISKDSALNLVVFGDTTEHLELLDGVLIDLLKTKWNTFVKSRFYQQFYLFALYFIVSLFSFLLRPGPELESDEDGEDGKDNKNGTEKMSKLILGRSNNSIKFLWMNKIVTHLPLVQSNPYWFNQTDDVDDSTDFISAWWSTYSECPLLNTNTIQNKIRLISEVILLVGAFLYILAALRESRFLGYKMFIENLMTAPSRVMFLFSCCIMMTVPWLRFACSREMEDHVAVIIMLTTAPYFLFFCRGFKTVGPFVVMIYRMVMGDLIRFVSIYLVFVMGFSQAYYIIFLSFDLGTPGADDNAVNPVPSPMESVVAMFLMSLTNFGDYYGAMDQTNHEPEAKILFVLFMVIVAVLLVNMLIAMMGNTYQKIAETRNEWQRQWARIVLVVERSVAPAERLKKFNFYSQPMSDGRPALVLRLNMTDDDKEEMKEILEMKRVHDRLKKKRAVEKEKRDQEQAKEREKLMNTLQNNGVSNA